MGKELESMKQRSTHRMEEAESEVGVGVVVNTWINDSFHVVQGKMDGRVYADERYKAAWWTPCQPNSEFEKHSRVSLTLHARVDSYLFIKNVLS